MPEKINNGSKYRLRKIFRPLVNLIAKLFIKCNISPNTISILAFLTSIISTIIFFFFNYWFIPIIFGSLIFLTGLLDGVDGAVARKTNKITSFGGFLDSVLDRYSDCILYIGFMKYYFLNIHFPYEILILKYSLPIYFWIILATIGTILVSYSRAIAEKNLENYNCDIGLGARSERLFILAVSNWILLPLFGLLSIVIVAFGTAIYRQMKYYNQLKKSH
ncbi:MAG: CDP-alcohol phosphatidyltransferase family protein [Promethearchaeota archaeon]|nr:MAG: CDP-alcohol phosphatidyltransferase family protein [Candidatus Lokiarchaeota archaeon]